MSKKLNEIKVGDVFDSINYGKFQVIEIVRMDNITVKFIETGFVKKVRADYIRTGKVKDALFRYFYGVGFFGCGDYTKKTNKTAYDRWKGMLNRCYNEKYLSQKPTYKGCTVCEEWHNFQNFAQWFEDNYPKDGIEYCLDKDLKVIGNKIYSPETCMLITNAVNVFMTSCTMARGRYMIGASLEKGWGKFKSACSNPITGKYENLGRYQTDKQAHLVWRKRKSELASQLIKASNHQSDIVALTNYKKALDNFEIYKDGFNYV